jgi:hypothetical protein
MRLPRIGVACFFIGIHFLIASVQADEPSWGHLSGRFLFDGKPPEPRTIPVTSDKKAFGPTVKGESLLVHPKSRGLANVVVYICPKQGETLPVHPSYAKTAEAKVKLAMSKGRFEPHVLLLRTSQTMVQENDDPVPHQAKIHFFDNAPM